MSAADNEAIVTARAYRAPHVMFRVLPEIREGEWVMRYRAVIGRGDTLASAAADFDQAWNNQESNP